ncbi:MAG: flavodoxin domain-containing protein, partial [Rhodobacterales bacterium]
MKQNLIIYSTTDGHTEAICRYIKSLLQKDFNTTLISFHKLDKLNLNHFDMIIIGASIRYGKHKPELSQFIKENINILNNVKTAFFSVNAVARNLEKNKPETNPYMKKFLETSIWK